MMRDSRPLDVMIVQRTLDPDLPLDLAERLRTAMTIRSLPHGARALELIEAGARPDIILVDRHAPGVDVAALRHVLQLRTGTTATAIATIDNARALILDGRTPGSISLVHELPRLGAAGEDNRLHEDRSRVVDDADRV